MKKILILSGVLCSVMLVAFTTSNDKLKGERIFDIYGEEIHITAENSTKVAEADARVLSEMLLGWQACDTKSVINQCDKRLVNFPLAADARRVVDEIIEKYNGPATGE